MWVPSWLAYEHVCINGVWSRRARRVRYNWHSGRSRSCGEVDVLLSRRSESSNGKVTPFVPEALPKCLQGCPALWEFLACSVWEDTGESRETGSVLFFFQDGVLKFMLNDRDSGKVAFRALKSSEALLRQVEEALLSDSTDWRRAKVPGGRK